VEVSSQLHSPIALSTIQEASVPFYGQFG